MDYITIEGYKSIKSQTVPLKNINILIGANGSGKSNFISFFDFLNELYNKNINYYISSKGEDSILFEGKKVTDKIHFKLSFSNENNGYEVTMERTNNGFIITEEDPLWMKRKYYSKYNNPEANIKDERRTLGKYINDYLNGLKRYHFHDVGKNSPFTSSSSINDDIYYLYREGANIAAFLYNLKNTNIKVYSRMVETIQDIAPYFLDFFLEPNEAGRLYLKWRDKFCDNTYGVSCLSDGTIRFIALVVLFMQPNLPQTIIVDEPELGLHPAALAKLAGLVKSVAAKGCQVIMATQSTDLISYFEPEDIITVDNVNGESKFKRLDSKELSVWLEDYTIDDLWKRNIITTGQVNY